MEPEFKVAKFKKVDAFSRAYHNVMNADAVETIEKLQERINHLEQELKEHRSDEIKYSMK